jgi:hypothetical protein
MVAGKFAFELADAAEGVGTKGFNILNINY